MVGGVSAKRRWVAIVLGLLAAVLVGLVYTRPVSVFRAYGAARLGLSGIRSGQVQAGPYRLRYLQGGSGPPLVLVHGLGSSAVQDWGDVIVPLSRRFEVYAPDLPGFGASERPSGADYGIPMQVEAVRSFMQVVGLPRARVAGISMGGWIVSRLAGEHPEMVERLLVVAAAGMRPDGPPIPVETLFPRDEEGVRTLVATVRHKASPPPDFVARDILARHQEQEWIVRRALESMREGRDWLDGTLGRAAMPVLVVWGKQDRLIPVAYAAPLQGQFPHAELRVLDGCGHVPMADCPEAFESVVLPFLAAADSTAAP